MFVATDIAHVYECADCGLRTNPTASPPERIRCLCGSRGSASRVPCAHLGELARMVECPTCAGNVRLKVHTCAVHDECTIGQVIEGLHCCTCCNDRTDAPARTLPPLGDHLAIAVITAPRAPATLEATLESLRLGGFDQPIHVFEDRDANQVANWRRAARWLLDHTAAEWLMIAEDDVEFCRSAADALAAAAQAAGCTLKTGGSANSSALQLQASSLRPVKRRGETALRMFSLYTPAHHAADRSRVGWQPLYPSDDTRGALAWCFERDLLERLHAALARWDRPDGIDRAVGRELAAMQVACRQHVPPLARHTGETSGMGHANRSGSEAVAYRSDYAGYRRDHRKVLPGRLMAIAAVFDPARAAAFRRNYETFRNHLVRQGVELAAANFSDVEPAARLWQKERLLNHLVAQLPADVDKVAWLDADVIFERDDWADETARLLERVPVVQPWSEVFSLDRDGRPSGRKATSAASVHQKQLEEYPHPGFAWAARRDVLERHALYDRHAVGGGDQFWMLACYGEFDHLTLERHNAAMQRHFRAWGLRLFAEVRGDVGCLEGRISHLWHGDLANRRYVERLEILRDFDPAADLALAAEGHCVWATDKPELHAAVARYFEDRRDDE